METRGDTVYRGVCWAAFACSANTSAVDVKDGKILRIRPLHYDEVSTAEERKPWKIEARGKVFEPGEKTMIPPLSISYKKRIYSPNRILRPMKRVDWNPEGDRNPQNRGKSKFEYISWDEATDIIAKEIKRIHDEYGPYAILCQADGHGETKVVHAPHGAQANMLDINYGTYPYVTSSSPTAGGALTGAGVAPQKLNTIIGIAKAYSTRVGEGPFVTELNNETGEDMRKRGAEYGATTGRPRRVGWLDLPVVRQAVRINGLTDLAVTKIDILSGYDEIPVCTGYQLKDGTVIDYVPACLRDLEEAKPVYRMLAGWKEDISGVKSWEDLPENCRAYVRFIEEYCHTQVSLVSVNPDRSGSILPVSLIGIIVNIELSILEQRCFRTEHIKAQTASGSCRHEKQSFRISRSIHRRR